MHLPLHWAVWQFRCILDDRHGLDLERRPVSHGVQRLRLARCVMVVSQQRSVQAQNWYVEVAPWPAFLV